jgi:hypothetical protein
MPNDRTKRREEQLVSAMVPELQAVFKDAIIDVIGNVATELLALADAQDSPARAAAQVRVLKAALRAAVSDDWPVDLEDVLMRGLHDYDWATP